MAAGDLGARRPEARDGVERGDQKPSDLLGSTKGAGQQPLEVDDEVVHPTFGTLGRTVKFGPVVGLGTTDPERLRTRPGADRNLTGREPAETLRLAGDLGHPDREGGVST
jgi:hypothetical protein